MRWYDLDPDVSMAISMIECANEANRVRYAEDIITLVTEKDTNLDYLKNTTQERINNGYRRWYDQNDTVSKAFSYLKGTTPVLQKEISVAILDKINSTD